VNALRIALGACPNAATIVPPSVAERNVTVERVPRVAHEVHTQRTALLFEKVAAHLQARDHLAPGGVVRHPQTGAQAALHMEGRDPWEQEPPFLRWCPGVQLGEIRYQRCHVAVSLCAVRRFETRLQLFGLKPAKRPVLAQLLRDVLIRMIHRHASVDGPAVASRHEQVVFVDGSARLAAVWQAASRGA
jgi:hypothetical protein